MPEPMVDSTKDEVEWNARERLSFMLLETKRRLLTAKRQDSESKLKNSKKFDMKKLLLFNILTYP